MTGYKNVYVIYNLPHIEGTPYSSHNLSVNDFLKERLVENMLHF